MRVWMWPRSTTGLDGDGDGMETAGKEARSGCQGGKAQGGGGGEGGNDRGLVAITQTGLSLLLVK